MKWLGLIGGTSWHSTAIYYHNLNDLAAQRLGGVASAKLILVSLDFAEVVANQSGGDLSTNEGLVLDAADRLKAAGAEGIVLCANTLHFFADQVGSRTGLPVVHIAEATARMIEREGLSKVALLGTKFTMEMDFFRERLKAHGIECCTPGEADRAYIHRTILEEMGKGQFLGTTKDRYLEIVEDLLVDGAEGVILGCTELPLLIGPEDLPVPAFDTTLIHCRAASDFAFA